MMPQDQTREHDPADSAVHGEVMDGLMAAKRYEDAKPRLSPAAGEEMLRTAFPRLPEGHVARELTPEEILWLRESLRDKVDDRTREGIANLRRQLTEYHSLLDQLSSISAKYAALEKDFEKRGSRIRSLEAEVSALKMEKAMQQRQQQRQQKQQQQHMHELSDPAMFQFQTAVSSFVNPFQDESPVCNANDPTVTPPMRRMTLQQQQQRQQQQVQEQELLNPATFQFPTDVSSFVNPFQDESPIRNANGPIPTRSHSPGSDHLPAGHSNVSPSPVAHCPLPTVGGFRPRPGFPSNGRTGFNRAGGRSLASRLAPPKRAISCDGGSANGTIMRPDAKRFRSNGCASPQHGAQMFELNAFPSTGPTSCMPEAA